MHGLVNVMVVVEVLLVVMLKAVVAMVRISEGAVVDVKDRKVMVSSRIIIIIIPKFLGSFLMRLLLSCSRGDAIAHLLTFFLRRVPATREYSTRYPAY